MPDTKILSSKNVFSSPYFTVTQKTIERNGKTFTKDFIQKNPMVVVIPYTAKNEIYMESQYRDALGQTILELVAGNIETDEDPFEAAKRELKEEAGLVAKTWKKLHVWDLSASLHAKIYLYVATDFEKVEQNLDEDEEITIHKMPLEKVVEKIMNGEMTISYQIASLLLFDRLRKEGKL